MRSKKLIRIASVALLAFGCNNDAKPIEGTVYKKEHQETMIVSPVLIVPENWHVGIADCKNGIPPTVKQIERECMTNNVYVTQDVFNRTTVGDRANISQLTGTKTTRPSN